MRFAVVGDPIEHSLSPQIHDAGYRALGLDHVYERLLVPIGDFESVVMRLRAGTLDGVNVTMPHKGAAYAAADVVTDGARRTEAVNTITCSDGTLTGHNTDIDGVRFAMNLIDADGGKPITVLGTGGAARAAMVALEGRDVTVMARSRQKATAAVDAVGIPAHVLPFSDVPPRSIVVNATPIGMDPTLGDLPPAVLDNALGLVEMAYGRGPTKAELALHRRGLPVADGLTMLVGQALTAFELFVGESPPPGVMMHEARRSAS